MRAAESVPRIEGVDGAWALLEYRGAARELIARVKYRNSRAAIGWLAEGMAQLVTESFDVITWAPANRSHRRERGFDHGRLLADATARRLGVRPRSLLVRDDDTPLTGRTAAERSTALVLRVAGQVPKTVLIVDDVITSGATLRAAARALRGAGAEEVFGVSAAYTPPPGGHFVASGRACGN
ncbi:MAG: phosphoribosyltransferase family protein [Acidimicrobiales bacterium]|nr:phosphoribosyltransferase family protein [Acidimicrobiales bacterium]